MKIVKNGFTLIELLAVVILLALILIVAIPKILNVVGKSEKEALKSTGQSLAKSAYNKIIKDSINIPTNKIYTITDGKFVGESLNVSGKLPDDGTIISRTDGKIALSLVKGINCIVKEFDSNAVELYEDLSSCELNVEKIYLVGNDPTYIKQGDTYSEPGFISYNEYGLDASSNVEVTNNINTNVNGTYTVTYVFRDNLNNVIDTLTRSVIVDITSPALTTHLPTSRAWGTSDISVTIGGGADTGGSGFANFQYCFTTNGTTCTPSISGSTVLLNNTGQYTICSRAVDNAGNTGLSTCSASNAYKLDKTAPTIVFTNKASWYNTLPATTITVQDTASGLITLRYQWTTSTANPVGITSTSCTGGTAITVTSGTTTSITNATATGKPTTTGNSHYLHVCAVDFTGNVIKNYSRYYLDMSAPTNVIISYLGASQTLTFSATDIDSGIASYTVYRASAILNAGTCGAYGAWISLGEQTSPYTPTSLLTSNCYKFYVVAKNNAESTTNSSATISSYSCNPYNCNPYSCNCTWIQTGQVFTSTGCTGNWNNTSLGCSSIIATTPSPYYICSSQIFCRTSSGTYCFASNPSCICATTTRYWRRTECTGSCSTCYNTCYNTCFQ